MPKSWNTWTQEKIILLKEHYPLETKETLLSLFQGHTWGSITKAASTLKLKKLDNLHQTNGDISCLLLDTEEAYYWLGFLLADGTFDAKGSLCLALSEKDKQHVYNLAQFLQINANKIKINTIKTAFSNSCTVYKLTASSRYYMSKIKEKFDLKQNKTKNPPDFTKRQYNPNLFLALIIGYFDGDGCIDKHKNQLKVAVHSSWKPVLEYFRDFININYNISSANIIINKSGYANWCINKTATKELKRLTPTLPKLNRKWDLV